LKNDSKFNIFVFSTRIFKFKLDSLKMPKA